LRWLANRPIEGVRDIGASHRGGDLGCLPVVLMERGNNHPLAVSPPHG